MTLDGDTVIVTAGYYFGTGNVDLDFDGKISPLLRRAVWPTQRLTAAAPARPNPPSIGAYEEITHAFRLCSNTSSAASLWIISLNGTLTPSPTYGPYSGPLAIAIADGP